MKIKDSFYANETVIHELDNGKLELIINLNEYTIKKLCIEEGKMPKKILSRIFIKKV